MAVSRGGCGIAASDASGACLQTDGGGGICVLGGNDSGVCLGGGGEICIYGQSGDNEAGLFLVDGSGDCLVLNGEVACLADLAGDYISMGGCTITIQSDPAESGDTLTIYSNAILLGSPGSPQTIAMDDTGAVCLVDDFGDCLVLSNGLNVQVAGTGGTSCIYLDDAGNVTLQGNCTGSVCLTDGTLGDVIIIGQQNIEIDSNNIGLSGSTTVCGDFQATAGNVCLGLPTCASVARSWRPLHRFCFRLRSSRYVMLDKLLCVIQTYNEPACRELQQWLAVKKVNWTYGEAQYEIDVTKNRIVKNFLANKAFDYLLCIAHDMVPLGDTQNILTAPGDLLYCESLMSGGRLTHSGDYRFNAACFRVHRRVLEAMKAPWFKMGQHRRWHPADLLRLRPFLSHGRGGRIRLQERGAHRPRAAHDLDPRSARAKDEMESDLSLAMENVLTSTKEFYYGIAIHPSC